MGFTPFAPFGFGDFIGFGTISKFIENQETIKDAIGLNTTTNKIPLVRVSRTFQFTVAKNVESFILWTNELDDTDTMVDLITDNERITAKTVGVYFVNGHAVFNSNNQGIRFLRIKKNNVLLDPTTGLIVSQDRRNADSSGNHYMEVNAIVPLSPNDSIALTVFHDGPNAGLDILGTGTGPDFPFLNVVRIG